ncbi:tetratricopeptide repeat protein [Olivibacter sp. SDN3]|uniref:tetratricopeptide repeat protein n=1 Tax=Olivibacter sp. SDN3 TaxID=2764720 RepID=UPI0016519E0B|nr:tetratricopeptide repeat protein [Olivibacter sp. SDN3]QNL50889.1 tetratricopeptide repeat protein [Olivibacter sp. SDN3]
MHKNKKTYKLLVIFLLLFSGIAVAQDIPADSAKVNELYYQALNEKAQGNTAQAASTLDKVLTLDPNNDAALFELARLELEQKDLDEAAAHAQKAAEINPENEWYWILLADINKQKENFSALPPIFEELIRLKPEKKEYHYDLAYALFLGETYDKALETYNHIEEKFGSDDNVIIARQEIYLKQKQPKKAISELSHLIEKEPDSSKGYVLLANLYLKMNKPKDALKILDEGHEHIPGDPYISLSKADAYHSLKDEKKSTQELKLAFASEQMDLESKTRLLISLMSDPDSKELAPTVLDLAEMLTMNYPTEARAFALYGDLLAQQQQLKEARTQYLKAIDINGRINGIWEQLLQIELSLGMSKEALAHAYKASALFPQQPLTQFFSGHAFLMEKKYTDARECFEAALNYAEENNTPLLTQVYSSLGDTYHALNMAAESDQAYQEALLIDSNNVGTLNNYAYYLSLRKDNLEEAARMSKKSNELDPNNPTFQDTYAWVLFQQGNYQEALVWIEKAIANSPETEVSSALLDHYGDILFKLGEIEKAVAQWKAAKVAAENMGENVELLSKKIDAKKYLD